MDEKLFQGGLPFFGGLEKGIKLIPVHGDNLPDAVMDPAEFMRNTYRMTDAELNEFLYQQAKDTVESGHMDE